MAQESWQVLDMTWKMFRLYVYSPCLPSQEKKIDGAVAHCTAKRLFKKCVYNGEQKYLVLVSDTVQQLGMQLSLCAWLSQSVD